jgi:hypothetical protein
MGVYTCDGIISAKHNCTSRNPGLRRERGGFPANTLSADFFSFGSASTHSLADELWL